MRPIVMCPITVRVARTVLMLPGVKFENSEGECRQLMLFDHGFAELTGLSTKRVRAALLNLERLGAINAEDLLPGPSKAPKSRTIVVNEYSAAWRWLAAYDAMELAFRELPVVTK